MRTSTWLRAALASAWLLGCNLSPGQDLPSAGNRDEAGDGGPIPTGPNDHSPGGDGDITIGVPEAPCGLGGAFELGSAGGHPGACGENSDE